MKNARFSPRIGHIARMVTKPKHILCLALVLCGGLFGCSTTVKQPQQYVLRPDNPAEATEILSYAKPTPESLRQIKVARISMTKEELNKLATLPKDDSIRNVRWLVEEKPNTMQAGPWNTRLYIFDADDTNHCVRVDLDDNWGRVDHKWLNGKMLFVEVWFGRIAWTDFILNTETLKFAYMEDGRLDQMLDAPESSKL